MLSAAMRRRLLALSLSLVLLLTQQLGAVHLLAHLVPPAGPAHAHAQADAGATAHAQADAGDALCQVCLVLATLAAACLPSACGWLARQVRAATPALLRRAAPARRAPLPWQARGPPVCLH